MIYWFWYHQIPSLKDLGLDAEMITKGETYTVVGKMIGLLGGFYRGVLGDKLD